MKPEQLSQAKNPLLPAAMVALRRAAQRARREAMLTRTAIVVVREGRPVRLRLNQVNEASMKYRSQDVDASDNGAGE